MTTQSPFPKEIPLQADWIWDADNTRPHDFMLFRTGVTLQEVPREAIAFIAAETKYWLTINGELAGFEGGLFRESKPGTGWADRVDLAPFLQPGENTVEALVWYYGNGGRNNTRLPQAGFYFACEALRLFSGPAFQCLRHPAYYKTGAPHPAYLYGGDNIGYDARIEVDNAAFVPATVFDAALFGGLYERPIPLLRIEKEQACEKIRCEGNTYHAALPHACAFVPIVSLDATGGEIIDVRTDRYVVNGGPGDHRSRYNSHRHEYICKPGHNEFHLPFYLYGEELIVTADTPINNMQLGFCETGYDCDITGHFECSDPLLNSLVKKAARTLYVCMRDNFMDCPDRERGQWIGDVSVQVPQVMFLPDDRAKLLVKKTIHDFFGLRRGDVLLGNVPGECSGELPPQSLCAIGEWGLAAQYYKYTGDEEVLRLAFEPSVRYLMLWEWVNETGLLVPRSGNWRWFDHGFNADEPVMEHAWYYMALRFASHCAEILKDHRFDDFLAERSAAIKHTFHKTFWNERGYYSSGAVIDDRANALAALSGLAPQECYEGIRFVLQSVHNATPYMENFVLIALCEMGYFEDAYRRMMDRYYNMAVNENSTLWEDFATLGTRNHAWSGAPATIAFRYFLGLDTTDGGKTWTAKPCEGLFEFMRGGIAQQNHVGDDAHIVPQPEK